MIYVHSLWKHVGPGLLLLVAILGLIVAGAQMTQAQTETVLYRFAGSPDGSEPFFAKPVFDKSGNLYGTTAGGGAYWCGSVTCGTVFMLTPSGAETILHNFGASVTDGYGPRSGLVIDTEGNLYGTTEEGGAHTCGAVTCGTVYKLTPSGAETILYSFGASGDGFSPGGPLIVDSKGNFYGTTFFGGSCSNINGCGTVFKVTPGGKETVLWSFGNGKDGANPNGGLVFDANGNLFGTTSYGGAYGQGTVFELTSSGDETVLFSFGNEKKGGTAPNGGLVVDANGNLYGTTWIGGAYRCGTVFELTPSGQETILHSFVGHRHGDRDGCAPEAGLAVDANGNLYGTTDGGGAYGRGTVFELMPPAWEETILWSFEPRKKNDGLIPEGGLVFDGNGNLYGTTTVGGGSGCAPEPGCGTVYKVTP